MAVSIYIVAKPRALCKTIECSRFVLISAGIRPKFFTKFHSDETEAIEFTNSMTQQDEPIKREISRRSTLCIT